MSSVVDQPTKTAAEESLGTGVYAEALSEFIENCQTPLTVGVQGEWGSGKTSILNMIRERLDQEDLSKSQSYYKVIWINTWEHSVLKKPEETLISIINEIIDTVSAIDGKWSSAAKAKQALQGVVKGAARIGVSYVAGAAAADAVQEGFDASNSIKKLRETLRDILDDTASARAGSTKFVIFIDDLDRLDPPVAVQVLELLKNIFDLEKCVFVLAIDYQVVVKGLKDKFGEPTEENEWEFRAFFDKIIQLPFMMPMASYNLTSYISGLLGPVGFLHGKTLESIRNKGDDSWLTNIVRSCIGYNPRSMKRLTNSLSMVGLLAKKDPKRAPNFAEPTLKNLTLSLVCLQIAFPKIFELLLKRPDFITGWDDDFMKSVTRPHFSEELHKEAVDAFNAAFDDVAEDWNEEWEKTLFKIVWINGWQRNKLTEISRVLSLMKDNVQLLGKYTTVENGTEIEGEQFLTVLREALDLSSVTSIAAADATISSAALDDKNGNEEIYKECRAAFWKEFIPKATGTGSVFDPEVQKWKGQSKVSSGAMVRPLTADPYQIIIRINQTNPLEVRFMGKETENPAFDASFREVVEKLQVAFSESEVVAAQDGFKIAISFPNSVVEQFQKGECSFFLTTESSTAEEKFIQRSLKVRADAIDWFIEKLPRLEMLLGEKFGVSTEQISQMPGDSTADVERV